MESLVVLESIQKSFDHHLALDIEHLDIKKGEILSILGPSGCGKTTLLRILAGFETPDHGSMKMHGKDFKKTPPNKRGINTVFQNYALFPHLTVYQNIAFGLEIRKVAPDLIKKNVYEMLELVQLTDHAFKYPHELSGGQKQRVAISRALVLKPEILLLDEPLAALDLKLRQKMLLELDLIHDEVGITFVFITHDQAEAMSISDRIAVMNKGKIEQVGTPREIYENPKNSFVAAFIGDTNFFEGEVKSSKQSDGFVNIDLDELGPVVCSKDFRMSAGRHIYLSVRPERFHLSKEKPSPELFQNIFEGIVEDIIYLGPQTKYWVRIGKKRLIVLQQHDHVFSKDATISWNEKVWISWDALDSYVLDRYAAQDEKLLEGGDIKDE